MGENGSRYCIKSIDSKRWTMKIIRLLLQREHPETYDLEKEGSGWDEQKKYLAEYFDLPIETTADRINKYYGDLALAKFMDDTPTDKYILLASLWELIGTQYKKAGETYPAAISYITAINALKACPTNSDFTDEKKTSMLEALTLSLKHILS